MTRPGPPAVLVLALLARIPITAAPLLGRATDRVGLRPVLAVTTLAEVAFWLAAPGLGLSWLLAAALGAGLLAIPVFSLSRQAISAVVPPEERRAGFSLDSKGVELSFAVGPAAGIWLFTATGARTTLTAVAALILVAGAALFVLDPPVRSDDVRLPAAARLAPAPTAVQGPARAPGSRWLTAPVLGLLLVTVAATFTVAGTDTAMTAVMTGVGRLDRLGLVFAVWCLASLVGGFVVGASGRRLEPVLVLAALAALCLPVALAGTWQALALLVVPTGLFCAPVMSLTAEVLTRSTPLAARGLALAGLARLVGRPSSPGVQPAADPAARPLAAAAPAP